MRTRAFVVLLAVLLLAMGATAFAEGGQLTLSLGSVPAAPGQTVTVTLAVPENTGWGALQFDVGYDASVMKAVKGYPKLAGALAGLRSFMYLSNVVEADAVVKVAMVGTENNDATGSYLDFSFKVSDNAAPGAYPLRVLLDVACDADGAALAPVVVDGEIVVKDGAHLDITTPPTKTDYTVGEVFAPAGMVVTYTDAAGTAAPVTDYTYAPTAPLTAADTSVTVSYTPAGALAPLTATQAITVRSVNEPSIAVTTPPTKTAYIAGEVFDPAGMVVTYTNAAGTAIAVTDYVYAPNAALTEADKVITITYIPDGALVPLTAEQAITVSPDPNPPTPPVDPDNTLTPAIDIIAVGKNKTLKLPDMSPLVGTWSVKDETVAKLMGKKADKVKGLAEGTTDLYFKVTETPDATVAVGDVYRVTLNVRKPAELVKKVITGVVKKIELLPGATETLEPTLKPFKATDPKLYYASSDEKVATVDKDGKITAVAPGTAKITVTATSLKKATVKVVVGGDTKKVILSAKKNIKLAVNEVSEPIFATVDEAALDKTIVWSIVKGDTKVSIVDKGDGSVVITGLEKGTAILRATASNGKFVKLTVKVKKAAK